MRETITSLQNPRVKAVAALRDRAFRRESGLLVIEGHDEIELAQRAGVGIETLYFCEAAAKPEETALLAGLDAAGIEIVMVGPEAMARMAYREHPDAWLAVARAPEAGFARFEAALPAKPFLLLLEGLEKPGNLGAILRSADAAGVSGVIASECRTDLGNPNVVRASKGTLFTVPVVETDNKKAAAWLAARGIPVYAAAPEGALDYRVPDYRGPFAVALGAEREGLSGFWFAHAAGRLAIPMCGRVNSLNVAQAATLFSYEALRQRSGMIEERNHA